MAENQPGRQDELAELRQRVRQLENRVAQIEQGATRPSPTESPATPDAGILPSPIDTDRTVATVFTRVAMLSFVLLGALILRILTQQHLLGDGFGTLLGFVYAGHLIVLSFLPGRPGQFARATNLFQCCGVILSFFIALESALRSHTLLRPTARICIGSFAALALVVSVWHRKAPLAATALGGGLLALVALGLDADGLALQLSLMIAITAAAALCSWRTAWGFLRLLMNPLLLLLLSAGPFLAGRENVNCTPLDLCAAAFWFVLLLQHLLAFKKLGRATVWLPMTTAWLALFAGLESWPALGALAISVSVLATGVLFLAVRATQAPNALAGITGMAATAVIAGAPGWLLFDPSGGLCAFAGLAIWAAARPSQFHPAWSTVSAAILLMAAAICGVFHLVLADTSPSALLPGALLAAILLVYFLRTGRPKTESTGDLEPIIRIMGFVSGLLVLLALFRGLAHKLFPEPAAFLLAQTAILTMTAVILTFRGQTRHQRAIMYIGLLCMFVSLVKVGFSDLRQLTGLYLLASIVLLGLSSVAISLILRRRA